MAAEAFGKIEPCSDDRMLRGLIGSLVLHVLVVSLIIYLLVHTHRAAPKLIVYPIEMKQIGLNGMMARHSDSTKTLVSSPLAPATEPPPTLNAHHPVPHGPAKPVSIVRHLAHKAPDTLLERLKHFATLHKGPSSPPRATAPGPDNGFSGDGDGSAYRVKDYIRGQIERRWVFDNTALHGADWGVTLHIELSPDGDVERVEVVETPRFRTDDAYRAFALSARNATLLSSPISIPPGAYHVARDLFLTFSSRQVLQ